MRNNLFRALALTVLALSTSACLSGPKQRPGTVGGEFLVFPFGGLPARGDTPAVPPARWTLNEFLDLQDIKTECLGQTKPQLPSAAEVAATVGGRNLLGVGLGGGLGTLLGASAIPGAPDSRYGTYGGASAGGAAGGAGAVGGLGQAEGMHNFAVYGCVQGKANYVAGQTGRLSGIIIGPYAGPGRSRGVLNPGVASTPYAPTPVRGMNTPPTVPVN